MCEYCVQEHRMTQWTIKCKFDELLNEPEDDFEAGILFC